MSAETAELDPSTVGPDGQWPLPWLKTMVAGAVQQQRGHALLVHGSPGVGALAFAVALAQSWLCEAGAAPVPGADGASMQLACGTCASCKLFQARGHPDLMVLLPETGCVATGWPFHGDKPRGDDSRRKPSRLIRIAEVRAMIDWSHNTSARGRGKVVVLHPAEALNGPAANALLKTLEEPAPGTRLILTAADPQRLLPTVRSRCQQVRLPAPLLQDAAAWLASKGVATPLALLAAASGRPLDALDMATGGLDAATWARLPKAIQHGQAAALAGWPIPRVLDALQKVCHDAMAVAAGANARFFDDHQLPAPPRAAASAKGDVDSEASTARRRLPTRAEQLAALSDWAQELARVSRHAEHPWNDALLIEALVVAGARAFRGWT